MCINAYLQHRLLFLYCLTTLSSCSINPNPSWSYGDTPPSPSKDSTSRISDTDIGTGGNACLYGDGKVLLQPGLIKLVWRIQVDDRVAVARNNYCLVSVITHRYAGHTSTFSQLWVMSNARSNNSQFINLVVTTSHFVHSALLLTRLVPYITSYSMILSKVYLFVPLFDKSPRPKPVGLFTVF